MTPNDQQNIVPNAAFSQKFGGEVPQWLHQIGKRFDLGVLIFAPNNYVLFKNSMFVEHCGLPDTVVNASNSFEDWLLYMTQRGDISNFDPKMITAQILENMRSDTKGEYVLGNIEPPNGKILEFKCLITSNNVVTVFAEDVTSQRRNEETLDLALEAGKSGYFHHNVDVDTTILRSTYLESILTPDELEQINSRGFWPLICEDERSASKQLWQDQILSGMKTEETVSISTQKFGNIRLKFSIHPVRAASGKLSRIVGFFEDITEDFIQQEELIKAKDDYEEALNSKTQFLARISHEVRTPMNAVIGIADALIHHNYDPALSPKLELIQSSAGNILNILDDTLNHSKVGTNEFTLDPKPGNPAKTIRTVCELWEIKAQSNNATIRCHIEDSVPEELIFDSYRYEQCLNNLLSNAIKFSANGHIDVVGTRIEKNGKPSLLLAVKDTGIGMTEQQKSRIFEPFQQGDETISRRFGGTGLGLNITKNLIEKMGGNISVKSEIGNGTIFVMTIPILQSETRALAPSENLFNQLMPAENENSETPYERLRILVADDNPTNHMVIKSLLNGMVAEVYTANDGQDVLDILQVQDIDIILMDIHMPIMDGIEATLAIRSSSKPWSDILIVAVTADPEYQQQRLCLNIGMDFAVAKPVKLVNLLEAFDHVLALRDGKKLLLAG